MDVFQATKKVGTSHVVCTTVRAGISQCDNVTTINGNQDHRRPASSPPKRRRPKPFTQAITGGTGIYRNAHGQLTVSEAGPQPATLSFDISWSHAAGGR